MSASPAFDHRDRVQEFATAPGLLAALNQIEGEGWNGPTGGALLTYVRREIVRPAVAAAGVFGVAGRYAEASGWSAAWEALANPEIRAKTSPWAFVANAVRCAVLGDRIAERYRTVAWRAWRIERYLAAGEGPRQVGEWREVADRHALAKPLSLTVLIDQLGFDRATEDEEASQPESDRVVEELAAVLVRGGWPAADAHEVVLHVAEHAQANRPDEAEVPGWRGLAISLGVPPWQARRVTTLLLGAPGWPGLVERLATGGPRALRGPALDAAVRATRDDTMRTPARTALSIEAKAARQAAVAS